MPGRADAGRATSPAQTNRGRRGHILVTTTAQPAKTVAIDRSGKSHIFLTSCKLSIPIV